MTDKNKTTAEAHATAAEAHAMTAEAHATLTKNKTTAEDHATFTLIVRKQNGKTIYRNENLTKEQAENLSGLNTLKLQNK